MPFELTNSPSLQALEKALARGGADREGADIAIVPLPEFVASQERLAALNLYVVFVTGFSRGREALIAGRSELGPKMAEAKGEQSWTLAASGQDSSTLLGLFALELGGIPVSKIKLADPSAARLDAVSYMAVDRSREVQGRVLLTSADANKLIPIVAVAPGGFIESNPSQLAAWANLWLEGQARLVMDAPEAARKVAKYPGAPEALSLVRRLGEISPVTLEDNARLFALAGRQPVTLERLVERTWQLWRGAGVLSTPAPARSLVSTVIVTQLAREASERMGPSAAPPAGPPESWGRVPLDKAPALLVERIAADKPDDPQLSAELGFLAGVFSRSPLRFGLRVGQKIDAAKTKKIIDNAVAQYELPPWQLLPAKTPADSKATGAIEVLAIP
jgi:ABC-type nitrate/sulfonate/bicarbonate transport system substrate-binding protein